VRLRLAFGPATAPNRLELLAVLDLDDQSISPKRRLAGVPPEAEGVMDGDETLLYAIDPATEELYVVAAGDVPSLTSEARAIAWLMYSTWEDIRTGIGSLPHDVRERVDDKLESPLDNAWDDLRQGNDPIERPADWYPNDENDGPPPFDSEWREWQGSPVNRSFVHLPNEILALGHDVGSPGASFEGIFFDPSDLELIRSTAESIGLRLVRDDQTVMRCWAEVWMYSNPEYLPFIADQMPEPWIP
jgi:hypothetical protein